MTYGMSQGLAEWWWQIFRAKPIRRQSTNTPLWLFKLNKAWSAGMSPPCISDLPWWFQGNTQRVPCPVIQTSDWILFVWSSYRYSETWTHSGSCKTQSWLQRQSWLSVSGTRFIIHLLLGLLLFRLFLIFCYEAFTFLGGHPFTLAWSLITSRFHLRGLTRGIIC